MVAIDHDGRVSFNALQHSWPKAHIQFYAFDVIVHRGLRRSGAWLKYKICRSQEFVIGGYTAGNPFNALIVGCYEARRLRYVSKVRAGFNPPLRGELYKLLAALRRAAAHLRISRKREAIAGAMG